MTGGILNGSAADFTCDLKIRLPQAGGTAYSYAAGVYGINSIANCIGDFNYLKKGEINLLGSQNYLRDNVYRTGFKLLPKV